MFKKSLLILALLVAGYTHAEILDKGSATDKAVAMAISKTTGALDKVVSESIDLLKTGKDFVVTEAPKVIREFILWRISQCLFWIGLSVLAIIIMQFIAWRLDVAFPKDGISVIPRWFGSILVFLLFTCPNIYELIYIQVAPRIYLIENLAHLIKWGNIQP